MIVVMAEATRLVDDFTDIELPGSAFDIGATATAVTYRPELCAFRGTRKAAPVTQWKWKSK